MAATHVQHMRARGKPEQVDAVVEHPDLRSFRRFVLIEKQPVMDVVAPERAIDEGQRVVVVSDLIGRDEYGGHQF